jgi:cell division septum initiation protein DivIVA
MSVTKAQVQALLDQARTKLAEYDARDATQQAQITTLQTQIANRAARRNQTALLVSSLEELLVSMDAPIDLDPSP